MTHHNIPIALFAAAFVLVAACGDDSTSTPLDSGAADTGATDGAVAMCVADPDRTIEGETVPQSGFEFRNAFDPSDMGVYDPADASSLPGPLMVDAWGDRSVSAYGTLGVFPPGFAAPLHTHSHEYYGVVLKGQMTNPFGTNLERFLDSDTTNDNGDVVLAPGSHWYVPAGSQHTTTCVGPEVCWFYFHSEQAFDFTPFVDSTGALASGVTLEVPDPNAVLLRNADLSFAGEPGSFVTFAPAWGDMTTGAHGTFGRFDAGATAPIHVHSADYYGVVITGEMTNPFNLASSSPALTTGGYWHVPANSVHTTACAAGTPCLFYFHSRAAFDFTPTCDQP